MTMIDVFWVTSNSGTKFRNCVVDSGTGIQEKTRFRNCAADSVSQFRNLETQTRQPKGKNSGTVPEYTFTQVLSVEILKP